MLILLLTQKEEVWDSPKGHRKSKNEFELPFSALMTDFSYVMLFHCFSWCKGLEKITHEC